MSTLAQKYLLPDWSVSEKICAFSTTRLGGESKAPFNCFNLGLHVGDSAMAVQQNRDILKNELTLPEEPLWLEQIHGADVVYLNQKAGLPPRADAAWTDVPGFVLTVMTADCLPVLFASKCGSVVAVAHAGWRGLVTGVLQKIISEMPVKADDICAWMGPAIGANHFEVGAEVRDAFLHSDPGCDSCFVASVSEDGKYFADIFALGRRSLMSVGVHQVSGGQYCSFSDPDRFFSHRRDQGKTGRMASLIWLK